MSLSDPRAQTRHDPPAPRVSLRSAALHRSDLSATTRPAVVVPQIRSSRLRFASPSPQRSARYEHFPWHQAAKLFPHRRTSSPVGSLATLSVNLSHSHCPSRSTQAVPPQQYPRSPVSCSYPFSFPHSFRHSFRKIPAATLLWSAFANLPVHCQASLSCASSSWHRHPPSTTAALEHSGPAPYPSRRSAPSPFALPRAAPIRRPLVRWPLRGQPILREQMRP